MNELIMTNNLSMVLTQPVHNDDNIQTTQSHGYKINREDVIVKNQGTITQNRIDKNRPLATSTENDSGNLERVQFIKDSNSTDTKLLSAPVSNRIEA